VSRNQRSLILIIVIFLFIFVSYSEPSVIRAGLMASIIILAGIIQRKYDLNNVIALTALLILLIEPAQFFEVGFQLSFVTAWGIILAVPIYEDIIKRYRLSRWSKYLFMIFAVSLTAQLFSAPLIILYFKQIPLYSLAANIIIVPLVSIALFGILALLIVDLILPILGQFLGGVLNYFLLKIVTVIEFFGANDNSVIEVGKLSVINLLFCYLFLVGLIFAYKSIKVRRCLLILLLLFLNIIFFSKLFSEDINTQQQAVVCKIPGGEILFLGDGDKSCDIIVTNCHGTDYPIDEYIINPFLKDKGISKIDNMIILSSQYDGLKGLINVAVEFEAEVIHISKGLEQSFKDISLSLDSYHDKFSVNLLKPLSKVKPEIGYYPLSNGMFVNSIYFKGLIITNIDGFDAQLENFSAPIDLLLLSNQRYDLSEMNILEISDKYKYIICSKIKQNFNIGLFNQKGHSNIIDLNQYRIFRVK
ncbi:MAG: ComEC/Rec2 family competence protein, partial [candidate division Zixibacteria bacterium]|nr:ComEC/Rec2 family competence protein [candidate division Zixibacteria bacterium]